MFCLCVCFVCVCSGYVAFNIANFDDMGTYVYASYLIIMNLRGEVSNGQ